MSQELNNVNFDLLVKAHGGNVGKARQAWRAICQLGGFGAVPETYAGGLDAKGIAVARDEMDHGGPHFRRQMPALNETDRILFNIEPPSADDIKRIEDYAAGDTPK